MSANCKQFTYHKRYWDTIQLETICDILPFMSLEEGYQSVTIELSL